MHNDVPTPANDAETPWTRLAGTHLWACAKTIYGHNGLSYHNFDHVRRLYAWAHALGLAYSRPLDESILLHDGIWDGKGQHELRSILLHQALTGREDGDVRTYIEATIKHSPLHPGALLALLDLADFMLPSRTDTNDSLLRKEAMKMQGKDFLEQPYRNNKRKYLYSLAAGIATALKSDPPHAEEWRLIKAGIERTIERLKETPAHLSTC